MADRRRLAAILSAVVDVKPHEISPLLHSAGSFFFILSAYFVVLPLRDEGAISLGLSNLPELFIGSLVLTLIAAPLSTLLFSLPNLSKGRDSVDVHSEHDQNVGGEHSNVMHSSWDDLSWYYISVRIGLFLWIALLNLITISSTWARVIDVMDSESGSRLFGFIGAGATLGQLFGSLFATGMAWLGPFLLLVAAFLMELAAQSSKGISQGTPHISEEDTPMIKLDEEQSGAIKKTSTPKESSPETPQLLAMLDGFRLILSSSYLIYVSLYLWLSAVVSSFFYFQVAFIRFKDLPSSKVSITVTNAELKKVSIIALTTSSAAGRMKLFAEINSFIALFIFSGQITLTGRILTVAGVTVAISSAPLAALFNLVAISAWPTWIVVGVCETLRKVVMYVVTRPGRELLFTVVSQEEKYKAKVCIDVIVQRLGDATAAGMFKLFFGSFEGKTSTISFYALPVCLLWILTALHLGNQREQLVKLQARTVTSDCCEDDLR
uniref:ADP,ATP carrier protein n=1 Tax=Chenopodium quinoa TaxID=63459 RepID=A0A803KWM2_CHEQI